MRDLVCRAFAVAAVVAALLAPAAAAKSSKPLHLSLIPLPKSSLGSAAGGLELAYDSGVVSNSRGEREHAFFGSAHLNGIGRISGYALHYGNEASGLAGVDSVWTSIDKYKNAKDASRGLNWWKHDDGKFVTALNHGGLSVTHARVKVPAVGSARFGDLTSYSASNIRPVSSFDEWFVEGRYLLDVRVAAGAAAEAKALAPKLAKKLDARLKLAFKGRLRGKPVKLPTKPMQGPPAGGPNLSAMALAPSDVSGQAKIVSHFYASEPYSYQPDFLDLSHYVVAMNPAGPFGMLNQEIEWFPTANEASFFADRWFALDAAASGVKTLDLSSVGDGARGLYLQSSSGSSAVVMFSTGQLAEVLQVNSQSGERAPDITSVAQAAANRINAVYSG